MTDSAGEIPRNDSAYSPSYRLNIASFKNEYAARVVYDRTGFTPLEERIIAEFFTNLSGKVLDIGCGTGRTTSPFQERGFAVIGIDISETMIAQAMIKHPGIDFRVMDACDLQFADDSFDYLFFSFNGIDCLHPQSLRDLCIKEMARVLKQGGMVVFSTHNALCLPINRDLMKTFINNLMTLRIFGHYRKESSPCGNLWIYYGIPSREEKLLRSSGFEIMAIRGQRHQNPFLRTFLELSPYYVAKKI